MDQQVIMDLGPLVRFFSWALAQLNRSSNLLRVSEGYKFGKRRKFPAIDEELSAVEAQKKAVMEEELRRWTVTYTKHVKQKRKVYQDGYLLLTSKKKAMLYDDCDKLLDSKFLKEDENLSSGETLTFGSYLVDIGHSENADLAHEEKSKKVTASDGNCTPGRQKISVINISPSRRIIREFKKNEKIKYALQERSPSSTTSIAGEWQALYTTHLTQKAKKFHDGFIKLVLCGSQGRQYIVAWVYAQAKLYDESKDLLSSRFLKKDEIMSSGETLKFDGYLVDIGDPVNNEKLENVNVKAGGQTCNPSEKHNAVGRNRFQLTSSKNDVVSSLKSRNFTRSYVTAHQSFKSGKRVEQGMNSCGDDADSVAKAESSAPSISSRCGNPPHETSSGKDVEPRPNSCGIDAGRVRLTESSAPDMSFRGANEILSFLKKPTPPSSTFIAEQAPEKPFCPSPELVILDTDYKERMKGSVQQESEVKVAQYEGSTQTISNSDEGAEPRVIPSDILHEIKIEKDSDDDTSVQIQISSAPVFSRSIERPTPSRQGLNKLASTNITQSTQPVKSVPLVDLEKPQPNELASFKGKFKQCETYKADPGCSEVGEKPKSVRRAIGIGYRFKKQFAKIRNSSTTLDECPSFDLGF
ncbi:hypothetical protein V2J09_004848 [Rumex salicifolius]